MILSTHILDAVLALGCVRRRDNRIAAFEIVVRVCPPEPTITILLMFLSDERRWIVVVKVMLL